MVILYSTAARIDEILSMKITHLHLDVDKPNATIIGKGSKIRTLYLQLKTVVHLKNTLENFTANCQIQRPMYFIQGLSGSTVK